MAYLGLVPSEASTGDTVRRGPITKTGNRRAWTDPEVPTGQNAHRNVAARRAVTGISRRSPSAFDRQHHSLYAF
jgi:transposase